MDQTIGKHGIIESAPLLLNSPSGELAPQRKVAPASPLRRIYRILRPIPRSPVPASSEDAYRLQLIPTETLTGRFEEALTILSQYLGDQIGAYVEFGVYNGSSMLCMRSALRTLGIRDLSLFGFDSFQGLPDTAAHDDGGVWHAGQFSCPRCVTEQRLEPLTDTANPITLIEGWYADTLSAGDVYGIGRASIVMIDSDTYTSARHALRFVAPILTSPSIIMFDDWKLNDLDVKALGEYKAFHEWVAQYPEIRWKRLRSYNRKSRVFLLIRR
ncbi:hypothetical protein GCM10011349_47070 [Novosphingobium indicum]|uniref:Macrocin O-methyltransferase n=1 Tax=Novosphingobium indicum TaxID=462949 RepID=A0ABQ2K0M5_9SPHN|nr:TylF/MycF/NovP-related O-methyltransferase [Novosphingobium indicum]GGN62928.1 hypothetical protein GCM10011349_47070 [Novosphingobium indicum]